MTVSQSMASDCAAGELDLGDREGLGTLRAIGVRGFLAHVVGLEAGLLVVDVGEHLR